MNVPISNNFRRLLQEKANQEGRRAIPLAEVARDTGLSRPSLYDWDNNAVTRFDTKAVDALCKYFGVNMHDLLEHTQPESSPTKKKK